MISLENTGVICKCPGQKNTFFWKIQNYFARTIPNEGGHRFTSPYFFAFNRKWCLALITNETHQYYTKVGFFLWMMSSTDEELDIKVNLTLLNCDENEYKSCNGDVDLNGDFGSWTFADISTFRDDICPSERLKFACRMEYKAIELKKFNIADGFRNSTVTSNEKIDNDVLCNKDDTSSEGEVINDEEMNEKETTLSKDKGIKILLENLKQVFLDGRMSDAVLKTDSREFNVHKVILIARSPVFASMFEHDLAEKKSNVVDIPDCTAESFEVFLHYLYSGSVENLSTSNVYNVYYAADKYRVDDLKEKCIKFMTDNISVETFCDVITLALRHGELELKNTAVDFFCQNIKKIIKTVEWQKYMDENTTQANELFIKALNA